MSFVLDNSVAMCWLLNDGRPVDIAYARDVLDSLTHAHAVVPALFGLEAANVIAFGAGPSPDRHDRLVGRSFE